MTQPTITDADREAAKRWGLGPVYNIHLLENYFAAHRELGRIEGATAMQEAVLSDIRMRHGFPTHDYEPGYSDLAAIAALDPKEVCK